MFGIKDIIVFFSSYVLSLVLVYAWIKYMEDRELGQYIREDGPKNHLKKAGIPTMGGIAFIFTSLVLPIFFMPITQSFRYIFASVLLFAIVGFYDDYKKIQKKQNEGLSSRGKFILLLFISVIIYITFLADFNLKIPFCNYFIDNKIIIAIFIALLYAAVTNASNFTDGLDGLLVTVTVPISVLFIFVSHLKGFNEIKIFNVIFLASILAYLWFNKYPAKVFMGDLGSLAIGGYVVSNAIILNIYWYIPIFALWYLIEVLSVIIQVIYFKKTGGKRFFKMAPFHHHLEHKGYSEVKIDLIAFSITSLVCIVTYFCI